MNQLEQLEPKVYKGHFGEYTITESDRTGVKIYRAGLMVAALSFAIGTAIALTWGNNPTVISALTPLYGIFCLALGVSLLTIHIYLEPLHRLLQVFWGIGVAAAVFLAGQSSEPLALLVYNRPLTLFGIGFIFVALVGIYFKEAFCFNRLETKLLTPIVPVLLVGHLTGILPVQTERILLAVWAVLFAIFAIRKGFQDLPSDIGDKSVFEYLHQQRSRPRSL
jgi:uncharacterized integral membrane protein